MRCILSKKQLTHMSQREKDHLYYGSIHEDELLGYCVRESDHCWGKLKWLDLLREGLKAIHQQEKYQQDA